MIRSSAIVLALIAALALSACGDDDNTSSAQTATTAVSGDVDRYCALTRQLDAEGEQFFTDLDEGSSRAEFKAAERRMAEHFADELDEVQRVAPRQIKTDVRKVVAALHERAGLQPQITVSETDASAADKRVLAYEKRNCKA